MEEVECSECGADLVDGQKFCSNCGIEIEWNEPVTPHVKESSAIPIHCLQCGE